MPATQTQIDKVTAAVHPLYQDPDFSSVSDITVKITQTPPTPTSEVDEVDVKISNPTPEVPATTDQPAV